MRGYTHLYKATQNSTLYFFNSFHSNFTSHSCDNPSHYTMFHHKLHLFWWKNSNVWPWDSLEWQTFVTQTLLSHTSIHCFQTSVCDYNCIVHQTCVTTLKDRHHKGRYCWTYIKSGHVGHTLSDRRWTCQIIKKNIYGQ